MSGFTAADWAVLGAYCAILAVSGWWFSRRKPSGADEYFLAGREMPAWAVAVSVLATSLSAATFIGAPQQAYAGNLTYLSATIGSVLAILIVAAFFVPAFYRAGVMTVYELLERRFGPGAKLAASGMFMVGRVFASGARVFIAAIPTAMIVFGDDQPAHLIAAIVALSTVAVLYTLVGGIRSIIWTDVLQTCVLVGAAGSAVVLLLMRIPLGAGELVSVLGEAQAADGSSKLTLVSLSTDPKHTFTLWTALFGLLLLNVGAYGTDHDLAQRTLTCRSARKGSLSAIGGVLVGLPVTGLFMLVGLLLYVFYTRPDVMGAAAPAYQAPAGEQVFLTFILRETPAGFAGLMMAGLFAAGIGSLNSALNAMAATAISDFYRPMVRGRSERHYLMMGRLGVAAWGVVLAAFACLCVALYARAREHGGQTLIDFALGVMTLPYAGLVAVFVTAIFTRRGNTRSAIAALATGFTVVLVLQALRPEFHGWWAPRAGWLGISPLHLAFPWQMVCGVLAALLVCLAGCGGECGKTGKSRES